MTFKTVVPARFIMGRLSCGDDLLESITAICVAEGIRLGRIEAIGAVQKARVGFYDQQSRKYQYAKIEHPMEIVGLAGNVSLKDGEVFVHAHISLGDENGRSFGGHLASGTVVFACELIIQAFDGPDFVRVFNEETGLHLWDIKLEY